MTSTLDALVRYYETLTPQKVAWMGEFYAEDAYFKDPFNEVRSLAEIQRIFERMFQQMHEPRFTITDRVVGDSATVLAWNFDFSFRRKPIQVRGVSWLRFAPDGRVVYHRDYWDTSEELYAKLPVIGALVGALTRAVRQRSSG